jgi:hypothetical protein
MWFSLPILCDRFASTLRRPVIPVRPDTRNLTERDGSAI